MIFRFRDFEVDVERRTLLASGAVLSLEPRAFDVLCCLLERRERVVTHTELLETVWEGREVADASLLRSVSLLRRALGDAGPRHRIVQTVYGRGYRLGVAVRMGQRSAARRDAPSAELASEPETLDSVFVGRAEELGALLAALRDASSGRPQIVAVSGEPGIGKTRLLRELEPLVEARGACVASGWCPEADASVPYAAWIGALRSLALEQLLERDGVLAAVAEDLDSARSGTEEEPTGLDPGSGFDPQRARWRMFERVSAALRRASERAPLVFLLDDMHVADAPSLALLVHLARSLRRARVLIVFAHRAEIAQAAPALASALVELERSGSIRRLRMGGLARGELLSWLARAGIEPSDGSALDALIERCGGNPLFLKQLLRWSETRPDRDGIPPEVRDVIRARVAMLSAEARALLGPAAVRGATFDTADIARVAKLAAQRAEGALDEVCGAGLIERAGRTTARFVHGLVQQAVYDELSPSGRRELHWRTAELLEERPGSGAAEIAFHLEGADALDASGRLLAYRLSAADRHGRALSFEQAAAHDRAAHGSPAFAALPAERKIECLLRLGEAESFLGDRARARAVLLEAIEIARTLPDLELFTRAALLYSNVKFYRVQGDPLSISLLGEALVRLGRRSTVYRPVLEMALAMHCARNGQMGAARAHFKASERAAQKFDSPKLRASMLSGRIHMLDSPHVRKRWLEATQEYVDLARELGDRPMLANALKHRYMGLLEFGDTRAMRQVLRSYVKLADQLYMPQTLLYRHAFEGCRHWMEGRLEAAERSFDRAVEFLVPGGAEARYAMLWRGPLLRERGLLRRAMSAFSELASYDPVVSASLALELCESGALDQARRSLHQVRDRGLESIPAGSTWLITLAVLSELSAQLADPTMTPLLIETLTPFAHCNAAGYGVSCIGPISYFLARLHTALGNWKEAERAFEQADRRSRELRSPVFVTQNRLGRVDLLLRREAPGDRTRARELLVKISATARAISMQRVVDRAAALRASL